MSDRYLTERQISYGDEFHSFSDDGSSRRFLRLEDVSPQNSRTSIRDLSRNSRTNLHVRDLPRNSHTSLREEKIEIISREDDDAMPPSVSQTNLHVTKEDMNDNSEEPEVDAPSRQSKVARVIACTAVIFLSVCLMMVGISLFMSKDIDEIVRNSNEMLKKHNDRISGLQPGSGETPTNFTGSQ